MTDKPSREDVLRVAAACGFDVATEGDVAFILDSANLNMTVMFERFAAAMYAAGAEGMRERAAKACDELLAAAKNLRDVKGRHHSEQAFNALVDVITKVEKS